MNIRCSFCQTPYTLSRLEMLDALQDMDSKKLNHYDAHCPRCRRATPVLRQRMEMFFPNWRQALKDFEAEMQKHPQQAAPAPASAPSAPAQATPQPVVEEAPKPKPAPKAAPQKKPAAKPKPAAAKSAPKKAPAPAASARAKKPAATGTSSKGKKTTKKSK